MLCCIPDMILMCTFCVFTFVFGCFDCGCNCYFGPVLVVALCLCRLIVTCVVVYLCLFVIHLCFIGG